MSASLITPITHVIEEICLGGNFGGVVRTSLKIIILVLGFFSPSPPCAPFDLRFLFLDFVSRFVLIIESLFWGACLWRN